MVNLNVDHSIVKDTVKTVHDETLRKIEGQNQKTQNLVAENERLKINLTELNSEITHLESSSEFEKYRYNQFKFKLDRDLEWVLVQLVNL